MPTISEPGAGQAGASALLLVKASSGDLSMTTPVTLILRAANDINLTREIMLYPRTETRLIEGLPPGRYSFVEARPRSSIKSDKEIPPELGDFELKASTVTIFDKAFRFSKVVDASLNFQISLGDDISIKTPKGGPWRLKFLKPASEYYRSDASGGSGDTTESMAITPLEEGEERSMLEALRSQPAARKWKYEPIHPANAGLASQVFRGE